jgi:hypothetical protein
VSRTWPRGIRRGIRMSVRAGHRVRYERRGVRRVLVRASRGCDRLPRNE